MSTILKPGSRLFSAVCNAEFIVVKAPPGELDVTIGGVSALSSADERDGGATGVDRHCGGAAIGKRFVDDAGTVELLCTKAGDGQPAVADEVLQLKDAKPLPASD